MSTENSLPPFKYWVFENFLPISVVNAILEEWPKENWPYWHKYGDASSNKYASKDLSRLSVPAQKAFIDVTNLDPKLWCCRTDIFPDYAAYGAGMHWIPEGGFLNMHLDAAKHPTTGWKREYSACLYLTGPDSGDLILGNPDTGIRVSPEPGKLVIFECTENALHGVPDVVKVRGGRKSIAAFFWSNNPVESTRSSANFNV